MTRVGVVVPIRAFALGKARLADHLGPEERASLARRLAGRVLDAAGDLPTVVVSSDPAVVRWASARGVATLDDPGSLNLAADAGREWCRSRGFARVVVAHADLPWAQSFTPVLHDATRPIAALVPCHRDDGTPVFSLPADAELRFGYGPGSFRRHAAEALRVGLGLRVVRDPELAFDVDTVDDLARLPAQLTAPVPNA